ncbi:GNAT family N-acetyltransferase [Celerinatantimonas sp. MCCC 1A17872]|uniref:GNAT family N-acetyltransferase n=1 Tax=Celerinatantimonas sp. MCCC 1A17872 TaxID=3177514 RepID=UPI0038BF6E50
MIRLATAVDLPSVALLSKQLGYPVTLAQLEERFSKLKDSEQVWVYEQHQRIVAWLQCDWRNDLISGSTLEIIAMVVDNKFRGRGTGRKLLEFIKQKAIDHELTVTVRSQLKRKRAHQFYQKNGFDLQKTQHLFYHPLIEKINSTDESL